MKHRAHCSTVARVSRAKASRAALRVLCLSCALMACVTDDHVRGGGYWGTKGAVQGVADELKELSDAGRLPNQAAMKDTVHEMAESAVNGAVVGAANGVKDADVDAAIQKAIETTLRTTDTESNRMLTSILVQQTPALKGLVSGVVSASLSTIRSELKLTTQTDLPQATRVVITDAVDSFATAMGSKKVDEVQDDLVHMTGRITKSASENAVVGLRTELQDPATGEAVGTFAKIALDTATKDLKEEWIDKRQKLITLAWVMGTLLLFGAGALAYSVFRLVRQNKTLHDTNQALKLVAAQINQKSDPALKRVIREKAEASKIQDFLHSFLVENGLK
jgi:hypothetical protein